MSLPVDLVPLHKAPGKLPFLNNHILHLCLYLDMLLPGGLNATLFFAAGNYLATEANNIAIKPTMTHLRMQSRTHTWLRLESSDGSRPHSMPSAEYLHRPSHMQETQFMLGAMPENKDVRYLKFKSPRFVTATLVAISTATRTQANVQHSSKEASNQMNIQKSLK